VIVLVEIRKVKVSIPLVVNQFPVAQACYPDTVTGKMTVSPQSGSLPFSLTYLPYSSTALLFDAAHVLKVA